MMDKGAHSGDGHRGPATPSTDGARMSARDWLGFLGIGLLVAVVAAVALLATGP